MSTNSPLLRQLLQILDENPDTWGTVLNISSLRLLEDSIAGMASVDVTAGNVTLNDSNGGPSVDTSARHMILNVTGSPGTARTVTMPVTLVPPENKARSKVYLVYNNTGDSSSISIAAAGGASVSIPAGQAHWVWCDGTDMLEARVKTAATADVATTATDADAVGGVAAANIAKLNAAQMFSAGQGVTAQSISVTGTGPYSLTPNMNLGNSFYHSTTQNFTLQAPSNATIGHSFSLVVQQHASAGPHVIAFPANTFLAKGGAFTLSTAAGAIDFIAGEYTTVSAGNRWILSIIKDVTAVS